jgi:hypothetical protein
MAFGQALDLWTRKSCQIMNYQIYNTFPKGNLKGRTLRDSIWVKAYCKVCLQALKSPLDTHLTLANMCKFQNLGNNCMSK